VFIYNNGTLSNVYNTLGRELSSSKENNKITYKENSLFTQVDEIFKVR
jgi:hypothetical protein